MLYTDISSVLEHNNTTVYAIIRKLVPEVKSLIPNLQFINFFTVTRHRNLSVNLLIINCCAAKHQHDAIFKKSGKLYIWQML